MKVGLIARGERSRGIGVQTRLYHDHLDPVRTLMVDVGDAHEDQPLYPDDFHKVTVVKMGPDGALPERLVRRWLHGLDVVLAVETVYDWRLCDWAREAGVRTVVHANPEFHRHDIHRRMPHPDRWWVPTTWRLAQMPEGTVVVPVPVDLSKFQAPVPRGTTPRFLHAVGKWAMYDRNGTEPFLRACYLQAVDATITSLHPLPPEVTPGGDWAHVEIGGVADYWDAYTGFDVLVMPRRYGGLSLHVQEAMAAGLAVVMPDCSPNMDWPIVPVAHRMVGRVPLPAGWMPMAEIDAARLAAVMGRLRDDPSETAAHQARSRGWAEAHSWDRLVGRYHDELADAVTNPTPPPSLNRAAPHDPFKAHR